VRSPAVVEIQIPPEQGSRLAALRQKFHLSACPNLPGQLSRRPADWTGCLDALKSGAVPADFLGTQDRDQGRHDRTPFRTWRE